jgi:cytoskeletal protein CcmA (bactofilin family)
LIYDAAQARWENAALSAGTGISVTNGAGAITIANTGVTSVTGTAPVNSSGGATPAISLASGYGDTQNPYASKTANNFLAAPNGAAGVPTFRAIVAADIPTLNQNTTGTASNVTGTVAVANGGTGATTAGGALTNLGAYAASNPSGYTSNTGTVTSVSGTGTVSGLSLSGTVTTSGNVTLGGTLSVTPSNFASQTANTVLAAPNGAAGVPTFRAIVAADVPTLNQNTTGTAANVTGTVAIANGGTGATTRQDAMDALAGATTSGQYLRGNGTDVVMSAIQAADVPTLNQNTTGSSGSCTGNSATATSSPLLSALGNYVWSASTLPGGYSGGIQSSFVQGAEGWQSYGSVMTMRTYTGSGGGALQMYVPYSPTYGGTGLQVRFGNYDGAANNTWTAWKTLLASDNYNSYSPTLTGGGASGTWGISVTGNAATATNVAYSGLTGAVPTWNQNTTGTAANVSGTVAVANGGTGATTAANALTNLGAYPSSNPSGYTSNTGTVTGVTATAPVVSSGGTAPVISMAAATAAVNGYMTSTYASKLDGIAAGATNVTNTNQLTNGAGFITSSGTAANVSGTVAVANGGTGATTAAAARTNLGATTLGGNLFTLANVAAIAFPRFNADNTVSSLDAATFRTAIGAGTSSTTGTVTSVGGTGTISGLTLTGTVTSSGNLTLGGNLTITADMIYDNFTATASQTTFTTSNTYTSGKIDVFVNGVRMVNGSDVTVTSGTTVVMAFSLPAGTAVNLVYPI